MSAIWTEKGFRPSAGKGGDAVGDGETQKRELILNFVRTAVDGRDCSLPASFEDFSDGLILINLVESLTGETIRRYAKRPRIIAQKIDNITVAMAFIEKHFKLPIYGCTPIDIEQGNEKQVVGLLFLLMSRVNKMKAMAQEVGLTVSNLDSEVVQKIEELEKEKEGEEDEEEEEDDDEEKKEEKEEKQEEKGEEKEGEKEEKEERKDEGKGVWERGEEGDEEREKREKRERRKHRRSERRSERCSGFIGRSRGIRFSTNGTPQGETEEDQTNIEKMMKIQSFLKGFSKKGIPNMTEEEADRLMYLFDQFKEPENLEKLIKLQAIVRRIHVQKAFKAKINRRNNIAQEILSTERSYKAGLETLAGVYQEPLMKSGIISPESAKAIFGSLSIVLGMCTRLLADLEERLDNWYTQGQRIADIFLGIVKMLKIYTDYVNNYNSALEEISKIRKTNKEFRAFMKAALEKCNGMDINSYLVLPIQRIPRYVMLLEQMYKYTPETHPDHDDLGQVVVDIRDVADYVNDKKRAAESQMQVKKCYDQITGIDFELVTPSRRFVYEGFLLEYDEKQRLRDRYVFLFNDLILVSHQKGRNFGSARTREIDLSQQNEAFSYKYSIDEFLSMEVNECEGHEDPEGGKKKGKGKGVVGFSVTGRDTKTQEKFSGSFFTQDVRTQLLWMARIDNGIADKVDGELSYMGLSPDSKFENVDYRKEGRLSYQTASGKWLPRLLVLEEGKLSVYRVKDDEKMLKESVPICNSSVRIAEVSSKENSFQVSSGSQILVFSSKTNSERYQWVNAIRHYIRLIISNRKEELKYQEKMNSDPNFIMKDLAKDQVCVDCSKTPIGWANLTLGLFHCQQCGGIHRTLGYTPKMKTTGRGKWSMEEVSEFRSFSEEDVKIWVDPEEVKKPTPTDSHSMKFLYIQEKYKSLLKEEESEESESETSSPVISVTSSPLSSSSSPLSTPKDKRSDKRATSNLGLSVLPEGGGGGARTERSVGRDSKKKTLEGLLEMKKGDEWVGFWVVIKKNKMQYKNKETKRQVAGEIDLSMVTCQLLSEMEGGEGEAAGKPVDRTFKISSLVKHYYFTSESKEEAEKWVGFIEGRSNSQASPKMGSLKTRWKERRSSRV